MQSFWGLAVSSKFQQSLFHFYLLYFSPRRFDEPSSWHGKRLFSLVLIQLQRSDKYSKPFAISPLQHWLGAVPNWESLLWTRRIHAGRKCVWLVLNLCQQSFFPEGELCFRLLLRLKLFPLASSPVGFPSSSPHLHPQLCWCSCLYCSAVNDITETI